MQQSSIYKSSNVFQNGLKTTTWKKELFFNNLRALILIVLSVGFVFLSAENQKLYFIEIIIANVVLIPLLVLKMISENSIIK